MDLDLDMDLEEDAQSELYCEVLVRYLLVNSALGECDIGRQLEAALDSADPVRMDSVLRYFESLPEEFKSRIMEGDPTLATLSEAEAAEREQALPPRVRPASA